MYYNVLWKDVKRDPKSSENLTQGLPTIRKREGPGSPGSYYENMIGKKPGMQSQKTSNQMDTAEFTPPGIEMLERATGMEHWRWRFL